MEHRSLTRIQTALALAVALAVVLGCAGGAFGDSGVGTWEGKPTAVEGQLIVKAASGVSEEDAIGVFEAKSCRMLVHSELSGYYLVELNDPSGPVGDAVDLLSADPKIEVVVPNYIDYPAVIPNDPRYTDQWGMVQMGMPEAWDVQTGDEEVIIAVIDTGVRTDHEDLANKVLQGRNTMYGADDPDDVTDYDGHGTHVSGIAAAEADNSLGVAGTAWECMVLPMKAGDFNFAHWDTIQAINWAANRADVINMSLGGPWENPLYHEALKNAVGRGVVIVAAAGNESQRPGDVAPIIYPAAYDEVIAVGATGPDGEIALYSNGGPQLDFVAPGGNAIYFDEEDKQIISCGIAETNAYVYAQGTSMASPHAAGCVALLLSHGVSSSDVREFLRDTAELPDGGSGRNDDYGYGIINMANAFGAAGLQVSISAPASGDVIEYLRPEVKVEFDNVDPATIVLTLDSQEVVSPSLGNVSEYYDSVSQTLTYTPPVLSRGSHLVHVSASNIEATKEKSAQISFLVSPHKQAGGLTFWGLPYDISEASGGPQVVFGGNEWSLARYDPVYQRYYVYNPFAQPQELGASLNPPNPGVRPAGSLPGTETPPRGLGYWLRLPPGQKVEMAVAATGPPTENYEIDLVTGWNMTGNPFPYYVDWNTLKARYRGREVTLREAIDEKWINPAVYRYVRPTGEQTDGYYTWSTAPEGKLRPWEAHWIKVLENTSNQQTWDPDAYGALFDPRAHPVTIVIPAAAAGARGLGDRALSADDDNPNAGRTSGRDEFRLMLSARCGDALDVYNFAGICDGATDGLDRLDVLEPPALPSPFVRLAFGEGGASRSSIPLAQDLKSEIGSGKKWEFCVATDQENVPVEITWPEMRKMPNCYDYILCDLGGKKSVSLRSATRYRFASGSGSSARRFELEIKPASAATLMVTGVAVSSARGGSGCGVSYNLSEDAEVTVRVLSLSGKTLRTIPAGFRSAGLSTLMWDRRDNSGRAVPKGAYICEVRATDDEGRRSRGIAPFFVR